MIGRFTRPGQFRELFSLKEFYLTTAGTLLIASGYVLQRVQPDRVLAAIPSLIAVALLGGPIIWGALTGLWARQSNVDELVALAIVATVAIGDYLAAAVVAFVMVIGSMLEKFTSQRARAAIAALVGLNPVQATVLRDGGEVRVTLDGVHPGDLVIVRPGEQMPVDGTVVRGNAAVNQAALTGESLSVDKGVGDAVYAGSVNYAGMLVVRVEGVGADTTFGKLISLVQEVEQTRAPILRVTERYARYFTPFMVGLSIAVYLATGDVYRAITVLIVGCPCVFILASPTAVTSALGNAARNGVLVKGGAILEELGRVNAVALDKTGTLTTDRPVVTDILPMNGRSREQVLQQAAAAEKYSEHPLARAILQAAQTVGCSLGEPESFRQIPRGIEALVAGKTVFVGAASEEDGAGRAAVAAQGAQSRLVVKENGEPAGYLVISDELRPEVRGLVPELQRLGVQRVILLTGDGHAAATRLAQLAGIDEFEGGLLPEQKLQWIRKLQEQGYKVAMVGDGINDAPSLAAADIGIAMGAMGTDAAIESADIALMADDLTRLPYAFAMGKATLRTINFNIVFAMLFNLAAITASFAGYLTPITGALTHNVGSVLVVLNSARLIRKRYKLWSSSS